MKDAVVSIVAEDWSFLKEALFTVDGNENAAVLLCGTSATHDERRLLVRRIIVVPPEAYAARNSFHLEVSPIYYNHIVDECLREKLVPVLVHSHRFDGEARYSPSDDFGEARLLGVLGSLLPGLAPASLVISHSSVNGREYQDGKFVPLGGLRVVGVTSQIIRFPRPLSLAQKDPAVPLKYDRQVRAFGAEAQRILGRLKIAVVGAGGIGSTVAEQLARAGVTDIVVVDDDLLEESNLTRVFGAKSRDVGKSKAEIATRHLRELGSKTALPVHDSAIRQSVLMSLRDRDLVFSCVDNDRTRAILSRFAHQYLVTVVDHGTRLDARNGRVTAAAGRVSLVGAGLTCLRCSHHVNAERIRSESMNKLDRQKLEKEGYVMGIDEPAPAVVSINTVVAGLGATAGLNLFIGLTGGIQPLDQIYDARTGSVFPVTPSHERGCDICDPSSGLKALGDSQVVSAYD